MDGKGLVMKWMVEEAGRSALMSSIPLIYPLMIWFGWKQFICHRSCQCLATRWRNCSWRLNHLVLTQRSKSNFVTFGGLLASAFPWLQPPTFSCGDGSNSKFEESSPHPLITSKQQWKISMWQYWINTSAQLQQPSRNGARHCCLQIVAILSNFWHPCRLGISQY